MTVKYKTVTLAHSNPSFLNEELRDFLVNDCGWTDDTPSGQDDDFNFGLGFFLSSNGEDGNTKIHMHLWGNENYNVYAPPKMSYLSAGITTTGQMSCDVLDGSLFPASGPFWIRVNDELILCSSTSVNTISFSQRGAGGTVAATHTANDCVGYTADGATGFFSDIEMYMHQDVSSSGGIIASSAPATHGRDSVSAVPGLVGYGARRFQYQSFLRITSGSESGKMRPITGYTDTGDFDYRPFLSAPGANDSEVVTAGFNPCCSRRMCDSSFSSSDMLWGTVPRDALGNATTYFFYGSKDGVTIVCKYSGSYRTVYFGNVVPFASKLTTTITAGVSAGATSIAVANRHLFVVGEKYRMLSTDTDDWVDNEDRSTESPAGSWPDLDPEEIPTEELVVDTITPGAGDAGTIGFTSALVYGYRTGAEVGEDPRPALKTCRLNTVFYDIVSGGAAALVLYLNTKKENLAIDASHRQMIRAFHNTTRWTPYAAQFTNVLYNVGQNVSGLGVASALANSAQAPSYVTHRYVGGLLSVFTAYNATQSNRGRWQCVKGTIPNIWWFDGSFASPPYGGVEEDTVKAWWGSQFETFRLFSSGGTRWFASGPEIT
ncbi:MAG: hypothetical protein DRP01_02010 [Archaeoglobales archaeon]|nr:MAG: hypothetical protein DRP01_02010 [Archaeoglobales archaeon]